MHKEENTQINTNSIFFGQLCLGFCLGVCLGIASKYRFKLSYHQETYDYLMISEGVEVY